MLEKVVNEQEVLAIIVRNEFSEEGISFFTPNDYSQQLAYMKHSAGKIIEPHLHNPVRRDVLFTQEVLVIKRGRLRVDFYDHDRKYLESRTLYTGDVILLATGGHGFEALDDLEMVEIKQGPYAGDADKTRFECVPPCDIKVN